MPPRKRKANGTFAARKVRKTKAEEVSPDPNVQESVEYVEKTTGDEKPVPEPYLREGSAQVAAANILGRLGQDDNSLRDAAIPQDHLHNTMPRLQYQLSTIPTRGPMLGRLQPTGFRQRGLTQPPVSDTEPATTNGYNPHPPSATPHLVQPSFARPADRGYGVYNDPSIPPVTVVNSNQSFVLPSNYHLPLQSPRAGYTFASGNPNALAIQSPRYGPSPPTINASASSSRMLFPTPSQAQIDTALESYSQKYLQNLQPFAAEEDLLMCLCLRPDDGLPYIECSNRDKCLRRWYHLNCLGFTTQTAPVGVAWYCPDCQRQQTGGAAEYQQILAQNALATGYPQQVWQPLRSPTTPSTAPTSAGISTPTDTGVFHVWNATVVPADHRVLGSPFSGLASPRTPTKPVGTPYRKPNKNSWSPYEEKALEDAVKEVATTGLAGQPLWDAVLPKLRAKGIDRCMGAIRNRYGRGLREKTGIDERRKPNPAKMTTSQQVGKEERVALKKKAKGGRYAVSRAWGKPGKTPEPREDVGSVPGAPRKKRPSKMRGWESQEDSQSGREHESESESLDD